MHGNVRALDQRIMESTSTNPRFKTKMCPFFIQMRCKYGDNCSFAHHKHEMRKRPAAPVVCVKWLHGTCSFGELCPDLHQLSANIPQDIDEFPVEPSKCSKMMTNYQQPALQKQSSTIVQYKEFQPQLQSSLQSSFSQSMAVGEVSFIGQDHLHMHQNSNAAEFGSQQPGILSPLSIELNNSMNKGNNKILNAGSVVPSSSLSSPTGPFPVLDSYTCSSMMNGNQNSNNLMHSNGMGGYANTASCVMNNFQSNNSSSTSLPSYSHNQIQQTNNNNLGAPVNSMNNSIVNSCSMPPYLSSSSHHTRSNNNNKTNNNSSILGTTNQHQITTSTIQNDYLNNFNSNNNYNNNILNDNTHGNSSIALSLNSQPFRNAQQAPLSSSNYFYTSNLPLNSTGNAVQQQQLPALGAPPPTVEERSKWAQEQQALHRQFVSEHQHNKLSENVNFNQSNNNNNSRVIKIQSSTGNNSSVNNVAGSSSIMTHSNVHASNTNWQSQQQGTHHMSPFSQQAQPLTFAPHQQSANAFHNSSRNMNPPEYSDFISSMTHNHNNHTSNFMMHSTTAPSTLPILSHPAEGLVPSLERIFGQANSAMYGDNLNKNNSGATNNNSVSSNPDQLMKISKIHGGISSSQEENRPQQLDNNYVLGGAEKSEDKCGGVAVSSSSNNTVSTTMVSPGAIQAASSPSEMLLTIDDRHASLAANHMVMSNQMHFAN